MSDALAGKRVLAVIYGTELFGSERGNLEALSAMQQAGALVKVGISTRAPRGGAVGERARELSLETFPMPFGGHFSRKLMAGRGYRKRQIKRLWSNSKILLHVIREFKPDILHFGGILPFIFCTCALLINRTPMIYRMGDAPILDSRFLRFWWKLMVWRSSHIVCISEYVENELLKNSSTRVKSSVIYNLAPSRRGVPSGEKIAHLERTKRPLQLVYTGQITSRKGVHLLVDALLQINNDQVGCWIVGGSGFQNELENTLIRKVKEASSSTKITFEGYQLDPRPYLRVANWNIVPSTYEEPLGNVVQEAATERTASIVSGRGGLPELIQNKRNGIIINQVDAKTIKRVIEELLGNIHDANEMGRAAHVTMSRANTESDFRNSWCKTVRSIP